MSDPAADERWSWWNERPVDVQSFRKKAWRLGLAVGAASFPAFYGVIVLASWPGRR